MMISNLPTLYSSLCNKIRRYEYDSNVTKDEHREEITS